MKATLLALLACAASPLVAQNRIGTGSMKEQYTQYCASCHGQSMEGGLGSSLIDDEWKHGSSDDEIAKVIREGVVEMGMVPWKSVLTEEQIRGMVILIREQKLLAESEATAAKAAPLNGHSGSKPKANSARRRRSRRIA